jgi:hypothetical protein
MPAPPPIARRCSASRRPADGFYTRPVPHANGLLRRRLLARLVRNSTIVAGLIAVALAIGAAGYHWLDGLPWLDATLNAAMILTGMGPVSPLSNPAAKVFAIVYALASGVFFLGMVAVLLAPGLQHLLHRFHLELDQDRRRPDSMADPDNR